MLVILIFILSAAALSAAENWPQFRGPQGASVAEGEAPSHFGPETNVIWKRPVAEGTSSPLIWGERLILTGFEEGQLKTFCFSKRTGENLWERAAPTGRIEKSHQLGGPANPTPVTDGNLIVAYFGSFGLIAYDLQGKELWQKSLPPPVVEFGTASSPIIADGKLILLCDQDLGSFVMALDPASGQELWKTERPEFRRGFSTPFWWKHKSGHELIVPGSIYLTSYRLEDGAELWRYSGTSRVANSTPSASESMLFSASWNIGADPSDRVTMPAFANFAEQNDKSKDDQITRDEIPDKTIRDRFEQMDLDKNEFTTEKEWELFREMFAKAGNALLAIRPGGKGMINDTPHLAWKVTRSLPYVSSPLYYQGRIFTVKNGGLASCYEAETGRILYQDERLGALGDYYSSAIGVGGKIYIGSQNGIVVVIEAGNELKVLARNNLNDQLFATPAVSENQLFYRTKGNLYCFGQPSPSR